MNPPLPILYSFRRCPYAMRARLAIAKSNQTVEIREVVLREKPQSMIDFSPKATVPVLVLSDGTVLEESLEIMNWALQKNDPDHWLQILNKDLIQDNDTRFKIYLDKYKYFNRHPEKTQLAYRKECEKFLVKLGYCLSKTQFLQGDHMTLVDAALLPFIRQFANVDIEWFESSPYKHVNRWLHTFLQSTLFDRIMTPYDQWHADDKQILF
ncbi:glutathione S-transferase [Candidatus Uhrbacteria bacterium]|nr:glutathione S-transferase [Candidatus Uhrbacteria bacterium]